MINVQLINYFQDSNCAVFEKEIFTDLALHYLNALESDLNIEHHVQYKIELFSKSLITVANTIPDV